jgi:hypothetical protein
MHKYNLELLAKNLSVNNIELLKFNDRKECLNYLISKLHKDMKIGWGGSMTLRECGILDYLRNEKFPYILDRDNPKLTHEEKTAMQRQMFLSDIFLSSANALTEDGLIVNVDGSGNRVAATIYGPDKVYFVVGVNKLVKNYDEAIQRIRNFAAPTNVRRLGFNTPCSKTLVCQDCTSKNRICNYTVVIKRAANPGRISVLLINEKLGL